MRFELNEKEVEAKDIFYRACKELLGEESAHLYYIFTPTGVGNGVTVGCKALNVEKDITDYTDW